MSMSIMCTFQPLRCIRTQDLMVTDRILLWISCYELFTSLQLGGKPMWKSAISYMLSLGTHKISHFPSKVRRRLIDQIGFSSYSVVGLHSLGVILVFYRKCESSVAADEFWVPIIAEIRGNGEASIPHLPGFSSAQPQCSPATHENQWDSLAAWDRWGFYETHQHPFTTLVSTILLPKMTVHQIGEIQTSSAWSIWFIWQIEFCMWFTVSLETLGKD